MCCSKDTGTFFAELHLFFKWHPLIERRWWALLSGRYSSV